MKNKHLVQPFIDELSKKGIKFAIYYTSSIDSLTLTIWKENDTEPLYISVDASKGLEKLLETYNLAIDLAKGEQHGN